MVETKKHRKHPKGWESVQFDLCEFPSRNPLQQQRFVGEPSSFFSTELKKKILVPFVTISEILLHG